MYAPYPLQLDRPGLITHASHRLTGLLSFMLTDEMTTGSITSTDAHKRTFAAQSHGWNIKQLKFREAFPEVRHRRQAVNLTGNLQFCLSSMQNQSCTTSPIWASAEASRPRMHPS